MNELEMPTENRVHGLLWWCMVLLSLGLLVTWLGLGWIAGDRWPIQWVVINGPGERVSDDQVRGRLLDQLEGGFFALDMSRLTDSVTELNWVATAELRREWPDTLHVTIQEHRPVAYWDNHQGDSLLLSDRGQLFVDKASTRIQGLPTLSGSDDQCELVIKNWLDWRQQAAVRGLRLTALNLSARGSWQVIFDDSMQVELGREHQQQRMSRMLKVLPRLKLDGSPVSLDMRYSNGLALVRGVVQNTSNESTEQDVVQPSTQAATRAFIQTNDQENDLANNRPMTMDKG